MTTCTINTTEHTVSIDVEANTVTVDNCLTLSLREIKKLFSVPPVESKVELKPVVAEKKNQISHNDLYHALLKAGVGFQKRIMLGKDNPSGVPSGYNFKGYPSVRERISKHTPFRLCYRNRDDYWLLWLEYK